MKVKLKRDEQPKECNFIEVSIGSDRFKISESVDGKLNINKISLDDTEIKIFPRHSNEIELS